VSDWSDSSACTASSWAEGEGRAERS
jgi:hypothetical protein